MHPAGIKNPTKLIHFTDISEDKTIKGEKFNSVSKLVWQGWWSMLTMNKYRKLIST